jgi:hypothetical protein
MTTRRSACAAAIALVWGAACGSDEGAREGWGTPAASNRQPVIQSLRLEPAQPVAGDVVRAFATARDPDGDTVEVRYDWEVGGMPSAETGPELEIPRVQKGTEIAVSATADDGLARSEPVRQQVRVRNRRPTLTQARVEPWKTVARGDVLNVTADGGDPDGDELRYHYRWRVNGEPIEAEGPSLSTAALTPGDLVYARVVAADAESESDPIDTARVRVVGANPTIVSAPSGFSPDGVFRYTIEVEQAHGGGSLRFGLRTGPDGMWVNPDSGEVTWRPTRAQRGDHDVELSVENSQGAVTVQAFSVTVARAADDPLAPPASLRGN